MLLVGLESSVYVCLDAAWSCQHCAFSIAPRLSVMLTGVGRML